MTTQSSDEENVLTLLHAIRSLVLAADRMMAQDPETATLAAAIEEMARDVTSEPDAQWLAHQAKVMLTSIAGTIAHDFDGPDELLDESFLAVEHACERIGARLNTDMDESLRAWQRRRGIQPHTRSGPPA